MLAHRERRVNPLGSFEINYVSSQRKIFFLYMFLAFFIIFSSVAPNRGQVIPVGNPPEDWQSAVGLGGAGFEPGTAGLQSDVLPLSHHAFPPFPS